MINAIMIEEEVEFANSLIKFLAEFNVKVVNFTDPAKALEQNFNKYDCLIFEFALKSGNGIKICEKIRKKTNIPIIISSKKNSLDDKINMFDLGADDYLVKPYDFKELRARIASIVRRYRVNLGIDESKANTLFSIKNDRREICYDDKQLHLTPAEYDVLGYLIKKHGFLVSREELACNCEPLKEKEGKSLDVIISRLRSKIGDNSKNPKHIFSVHGVGYKLIG